MVWKIEWDDRAIRDAQKLSVSARRDIVRYLKQRIATREDPRRFGKALLREKAGLWRYRVGDYRIVCRIEDQRLIVLVILVGHRKEVYD